MIGQRTVDAHMNGDCWSPTCPICDLEDAAAEMGAADEDDA